ncbi:uncharacterized protein TNCV_2249281 [Trichonephila clavipes]|nr:uncharacterized protein TNCV_2249281 [Trichonephila clavipes]
MGFRSRSPTHVHLLARRDKVFRLVWAHQYRHWTVDDWKPVAWNDESHFQLNRADGSVWVWRQPHESMDPYMNVQAGGDFVMIWGVCSWRDMGPLIRLDTTMTGERYVSILSDHHTSIHIHCAFRWTWAISEGQCDTPHIKNYYRMDPRAALFLI